MPPPLQKFDDRRGRAGLGGWWISLDEARRRSIGHENWWTQQDRSGRRVPVQQYDVKGPKSRPVWLFENGDMYLGEWIGRGTNGLAHPVEHGLGVTYNNFPIKKKGLIYLGGWKEGLEHGVGYSFWLKSSVAWSNNKLAASEIQDMSTLNGHNKHPGLPYCYYGKFDNDVKSDDHAVVSLKCGSTRRGPWRNNVPVDKNNEPASWYSHDSVAAATGPAAASRQHQEERKIAASAVTPTNKRKARETTSRPTQPPSKRRGSLFKKKIGPAAATTYVRTRGVAIKQEEPRDAPGTIEIQDDDSDDDSEAPLVSDLLPIKQEEIEESVERQADPTMTNKSQEEEAARIQEIHDWLAQHVIGNGPNPDTMQSYACELYELGFESVDMVLTNTTKYLTEEHIQSFAWMKPLHKQMLIDFLHGTDKSYV
jgi:hypothetical protein